MGRYWAKRPAASGKRCSTTFAEGECTPFLGPGVTAHALPSLAEIAQRMAQENGYPFADPDKLPRVAQFLGTQDNRRLRRQLVRMMGESFQSRLGLPPEKQDRRTLAQLMEAADWSSRCRELGESEIHHQLADLGLPLYLTTNFDNFMTLALMARSGPDSDSDSGG